MTRPSTTTPNGRQGDTHLETARARRIAALAAVDAANRCDPNSVGVAGASVPLALAEGQAASAWIQRLRAGEGGADAVPDALLIAARGHHIRRWESPREAYPRDRAGYHAWRAALYEVHAQHLAAIMREAGYDADDIARMSVIVHRRGIKTDPDVQTYEYAVTLAFLELQAAPFAERTDRATTVRALRRTWHKMSEHGHEAALRLPLTAELESLLYEALTTEGTA